MRIQPMHISLCFLVVAQSTAFTTTTTTTTTTTKPTANKVQYSSLFPLPRRHQPQSETDLLASPSSRSPALTASSTAISPTDDNTDNNGGGFLSLKTKYGYINPFAVYYGTTSILLGLPWFVALNICQIVYKLIGHKFDKLRRLPITISHVWGVVLMRLTRSYPTIEGKEMLDKFFKENRAAMFVANHNAWMDIPFVGATVGWRNYKMVSKAELGNVPILGRAIKVGGHVMVDRTSRKSQLMTLKAGMQWLKDGVHLITFPEGTRSKNGRLLPFKNGAFKMAHKVGAPVVPLSIVHANVVNPPTWMFPKRHSHGVCKVVVHEPIESDGITEDELFEKVRASIIDGLPEDQKPLN